MRLVLTGSQPEVPNSDIDTVLLIFLPLVDCLAEASVGEAERLAGVRGGKRLFQNEGFEKTAQNKEALKQLIDLSLEWFSRQLTS